MILQNGRSIVVFAEGNNEQLLRCPAGATANLILKIIISV